MWSQTNVVSNEQVSNVVVSNERGLKLIGLNYLHTQNVILRPQMGLQPTV